MWLHMVPKTLRYSPGPSPTASGQYRPCSDSAGLDHDHLCDFFFSSLLMDVFLTIATYLQHCLGEGELIKC